MPLYLYKARNLKGDIEKDVMDAAEKAVVQSILKNRGLFPVEIKETTHNKVGGKKVSLRRRRVSILDLYIFCKQFSIMINAGVPIVVALDVLIKQEENATLKNALRNVAENVHKGFSLSESMKQHSKVFPNILVSMVEVGEMSGNLDRTLEDVAIHFEKENTLRGKIKSAMIYPAFILVVAIAAVVFMIAFVVPKFVAMFDAIGGDLPAMTTMVLNIAYKLREPLFILKIVLSILIVFWTLKALKKSKGGGEIIDKLYFKIPLLKKEFKNILAARFARTLGILVSAGVSIIQSFDVIAAVVNNKVVTKGIENVKNEIRGGSNIADPLADMDIFPRMVIQMIRVGEETGTLETTVAKVAEFYDEEVDRSVKRLTSIIEPVMILLIAILVGVIVVAMIMPVFSMEQQLGSML